MKTLSFLILALSPFIIFDSDNPLISCPLCKSKTLWNISMIFGRNVEQDQTTCCLQEWQLCLSNFWRYLPLLNLTVIIHWFRSCPLCKSKTLWNIFMILGRNVEDVSRIRMTTLPFLPLALSPFVMSDSDYPLISCPLCKSKTPMQKSNGIKWFVLEFIGTNFFGTV